MSWLPNARPATPVWKCTRSGPKRFLAERRISRYFISGFRLIALHRQAAKGNPSFNACRETCREAVYHHNLILHDPAAGDIARTIRVGAMVVRHLALFIGGKLQADGLGEFCCSSRPIRQADAIKPETAGAMEA
jgi:hypothetical protein